MTTSNLIFRTPIDELITEHFDGLGMFNKPNKLNYFLNEWRHNLSVEHQTQLVFISIALSKETELLQVILSSQKLSEYYLYSFFYPELFVLLQEHNPELLPNLISIQKTLSLTIPFLFDKYAFENFKHSFNKIKTDFCKDIVIKSIYDICSWFTLQLTEESSSDEISDLARAFVHYLVYTPNRYDTLFIKSVLEAPLSFQKSFFSHLRNILSHKDFVLTPEHNTHILKYPHLFTHLFSSPFLSSLAFKSGDELLISFCDIKEHSTTHPELFCM